jgi:endonuclease IV
MLSIGHHVNHNKSIFYEITSYMNTVNTYFRNNIDQIKSYQVNKIINSIQIFNIGPRNYNIINYNREDLAKFCKTNNINLCIHANYMLNISIRSKLNIGILTLEVHKAIESGASCLVVHVARSSLNDLIETISYINSYESFKNLKDDLIILLEAKACKPDKGTNILNDINSVEFVEFMNFLKKIKVENNKLKIRVCIDTAHIWAYGIDLTDENQVNKLCLLFDNYNDIINMLQWNDSINKLGSGKDEHTLISKGVIFHSSDIIHKILKSCIKNNIVIIYERTKNYDEYMIDYNSTLY